jgi:hypothetical protein
VGRTVMVSHWEARFKCRTVAGGRGRRYWASMRHLSWLGGCLLSLFVGHSARQPALVKPAHRLLYEKGVTERGLEHLWWRQMPESTESRDDCRVDSLKRELGRDEQGVGCSLLQRQRAQWTVSDAPKRTARTPLHKLEDGTPTHSPLQDKSMGSNVLSWSQYSGRLWVMLLRASRQGPLFIDYFCHIRISGVAQFPSLIGQAGLFLCNTSAHWWREHLGSPELRRPWPIHICFGRAGWRREIRYFSVRPAFLVY